MLVSHRSKSLRLVAAALGVFAVAATGLLTVSYKSSPELAWRLEVLWAKLSGELPGVPMLDLARWLKPGSVVYLAPLAGSNNPHAAVRNVMVGAADAAAGEKLYASSCTSCHGSGGRGHSAPSLVDAVASKSDWTFFTSVKWGVEGSAMLAQPLDDAQIWQVHAYLRQMVLERDVSARGAQSRQAAARAGVSIEPRQLLGARADPTQWLTYAGAYDGQRHSALTQVTRENVAGLGVAWVAQMRPGDRELQVSPLVAGGVMYVTESREGVVALDARTGEVRWRYRRSVPDGLQLCCGMPNRGAALLGDTLYVGTIDAHLVALDANTGRQRWITKVAEHRDGYSITGAPLALPDRIVTGVAGSVYGARGFLAAFDPASGRQLWKFDTVPGPGEPGHETWEGDSWKHGGAATWTTGSYDAEQDLILWGTGNPAPQFHNANRKGDNLYSNCVLAIEAKTGRLRWHYQFTPGEAYDWDSTQQPVLTEVQWQGQPRRVLTWANRNGFYYVIDRTSGEFLFARPFVKQTWNDGFDAKGRPRYSRGSEPTPQGTVLWPATMAATNWWTPSLDAKRGLLFVPSSDAAGIYYSTDKTVTYRRDRRYEGLQAAFYSPNHPAIAYVKAIDVQTGEIRWQTELARGPEDFVWTVGSMLSTAGGLVFSGYRDHFRAFDADTGRVLWSINLGGRVRGSPIAFALDGRQYVAVAAGSNVFAFALPALPGGGGRAVP